MRLRSTRIPLLLSLALLATATTACAPKDASADQTVSPATSADAAFPMEIDNCGEKLVIEKRPEKVLTIGPDPLAQLASAGAADRVVSYSALLGVELPTLPGLEAEELTSDDPSTEQILSTGADFVVANAYLNTDPQTLEENGITTWTPSSVCDHLVTSSSSTVQATVPDKPVLDRLRDDLETIGKIFETDRAAADAVRDMDARLKDVASKNIGKNRSVAIVYYFDEKFPVGAIGDGGIVNAFAQTLGLKNVFSDQKRAWLEDVSWESVLDRDPDVILLITDMSPGMDFDKSKARLLAEQGADRLKAVKNDSLVHIKYHQGIAAPLSLDGLENLAEQLEQ